MQLTVHATRRTPHGALRLVLAMSCLVGEIRRAPSRHCRDARVYGRTTTAMHDNEYPPTHTALPANLLWFRFHRTAYERSHPVVDFELTDDGPTYLVVGGAGNREGHAGERDRCGRFPGEGTPPLLPCRPPFQTLVLAKCVCTGAQQPGRGALPKNNAQS